MQHNMSLDFLDKQGDSVCQKYADIQGVVLWGCGEIARQIAPVFKTYDLLDSYIDNDNQKQKTGWDGYKVWSPEEFLGFERKRLVVITASEKNTLEIKGWLNERGLREGEDFVEVYPFLKNVFPVWSFYKYDKLYVEVAQICLTERCTLKCEKCAHGCNKVPMNQADMSWEEIAKSADSFFHAVDFVREFVLIGGEPFLSKELGRAIQYIGDNYRDQIGLFTITTNGTIVPSEEIIALCKQYDVAIRLSDYEATIPRLAEPYRKFYEATKDLYKIVWKTNDVDTWYDYGFGEVDHGTDIKELCRVFQRCHTLCREVRGNRYYYCVMARSVSENVGYDVGLEEYYDLSQPIKRKELFAYEMGYIPNGYLSMCRYCRGIDAYDYLIPAAVQETNRG